MFRFRRDVYLDNNATTIINKPVIKKMEYVLKRCYGNPSSLYKAARNAAVMLDESRSRIVKTINADFDELYFTGSATEANNAILKSVSAHFSGQKNKIIATPIEHASVMSTLEHLSEQGIMIEFCPIDKRGRVDINAIAGMIDDKTFLICCMFANNEIGTVQDIATISEIARSRDVLIMSDCVQALGKLKVDVRQLGLDYATFSAHKLHGPKGIGAMYIRDGAPFAPFIHGGHQEYGRRAGTESLHNIAGFAAAVEDVDDMLSMSDDVTLLKGYFVERLKEIKPDIIINSPADDCLPNTVSATFPQVNNAVFMAMLDYNGISVSAGSACNTQDDKPSHVLKAIGLTDDAARNTIRFSLSPETSEKDIRYTLKVIKDYFEDNKTPINMFKPSQVDENFLFDDDTYIFDIRFWYDKKLLKGLPNSHEGSFLSFKKYVHHVPKDKNILVVCQMGYNSPVVAYHLKSKHYKNVGFLLTGAVGWKLFNPELYRKYAGQNIEKLEPKK